MFRIIMKVDVPTLSNFNMSTGTVINDKENGAEV